MKFLADFQSAYFIRKIWKKLRQGQLWRGEIAYRSEKDGPFWIDATIVPLYDEAGNLEEYILIGHDITEQKHADEILRESDKLSALGQMAAGVAHEIRNPLTALKGFVQIMQMGLGDKPEYLQIMSGELERMNGIVEELLQLARPRSEKELTPQDAKDLVRQVVMLLENQAFLRQTRIVVAVPEDPALVLCDENRLKQAFLCRL